MSNCTHAHLETYDTGYGVDSRCLDCNTITEAEDKPKPFVARGITLPDHIRCTIDAYVAHGTRPGSCLTAIIDNNLSLAVGRADEEHLATLSAIVGYLFEHCDMRSWGHANSCEDWIARKSRERLLRRAATQVEAENFL